MAADQAILDELQKLKTTKKTDVVYIENTIYNALKIVGDPQSPLYLETMMTLLDLYSWHTWSVSYNSWKLLAYIFTNKPCEDYKDILLTYILSGGQPDEFIKGAMKKCV